MQSNPLALRLVQNKYLAAQQKRSVFTGLTERPLRPLFTCAKTSYMQKQSEANLLPVFLEIYLTKDTNNNVMPNASVFCFYFCGYTYIHALIKTSLH